MVATIIVILFVFIIIYLYFRYKLTFWKRQGVPQDVLHSFKMFRNVMPFTDMQLIQKEGKVVGTYELIWLNLLVAEPSLITQILISKFPQFSDRRTWVPPDQHMGKCIVLIPYKEWKPSRATMTQAFKPSNIKLMQSIIIEEIEIFLNKLDQVAEKGASTDIKLYLEALITGIIMRAFFGTRINSSQDHKHPLVEYANNLLGSDISLGQLFAIFAPNLARVFGFQALNVKSGEYMATLLAKIIKARRERNSKECDFVQYLLDADDGINKKFSDKEVIDNCMVFHLATMDTTTSVLTHLVYFLAVNPKIQENIFEEMAKTEINIDTINKLVYFDACIHETLRFYPPVSRIERKVINDTKLGDVFIPRNSFVSIPVYAVHHDPDNFDEPEKFIPERFLPENQYKIKPGTFLGFADGPRNCIGMKFALATMKLCMAKILQKYILLACDETKPPEFYCGNPTISPKSIYLKIARR